MFKVYAIRTDQHTLRYLRQEKPRIVIPNGTVLRRSMVNPKSQHDYEQYASYLPNLTDWIYTFKIWRRGAPDCFIRKTRTDQNYVIHRKVRVNLEDNRCFYEHSVDICSRINKKSRVGFNVVSKPR